MPPAPQTPIPKIPTLTPTTPPQLNKTNINVPEHDTVYLYSKPSLEANIIYKLTTSQAADIVVETKRWAKVILSKINIEGWVSQDFIQKNTP